MSVVNAPPRKDVYLIWGQFGALGGRRVHSQGRLWLLTDDVRDQQAPVRCRIAWNDPMTGNVVYEDLGDVDLARIRTHSAEVHLASGGQPITLVIASCVCGAGAVGNALPDPGRISLNYVNPYDRPRIVFVA